VASWYAAYQSSVVTREGIVAEHRPVLEITRFEFIDKNNLKISGKNSGRSTALKLRNEPWCDIGKYVGGVVGEALKVEKSFPVGMAYMPDVPTGDAFEMYTYIPGELWFQQEGVHYTDASSLRLHGVLHYQDAQGVVFELPWCYESFQPKTREKPAAIPCYDVPAYKMP
jgi:hypothetical protein